MKRRTFIRSMGVAVSALPFAFCSGMSRGANIPEGAIERRTLGKTGIQISRLGIGSHIIEDLIKKPELRNSMIKTAFDRGINFFDVYDGNYKQYAPMGKSLEGFRKQAVISVSLGSDKELTDALTKFNTDYIDCCRLINTVNDTNIKFCESAKKAGKIRAIGVACHEVEATMNIIDQYGDIIDFIMFPVNFHHNKGAPALIPRCKDLGLGVIAMKPMGSEYMIQLARERGMFDKNGMNIAKAMLRHVYSIPEVDVAIPAINSMVELKENLEAAYNPAITSEEKKLLSEMSDIAASTRGAYLGNGHKFLEILATNRLSS